MDSPSTAAPKRPPPKKIRSWILALAALAACAGPAACRRPPPPEQSSLRVGLIMTQDYLPFFVIEDQGLDRRQGLKLERENRQYPSGAAILEAIADGSVDVASVGTVPLIAAAEGPAAGKLIAVAANSFADPEHPASAVLTGAHVGDWKDLEGKLIAVNAANSIQGVAIKARLKMESVVDYKLVEMSFANMGLAVAGGNVAAATLYEPFLSQSLLRGDGRVLGWIIGGPPFERMESTAIVAGAGLYRGKPNTMKAFLRAYLEAVEWINRHPAEARALLGRRMELSTEIGRKINLLRWPTDGRNDPASLDHIQSVMIDIGALKAKIPPERIYDETLLKEVLAEKR